MENYYDVIVLGAGAAGLTAGIYLKRSSLSSVLLEKAAPGGKLNNIHRIDNYPGCPEISGPELSMRFYEQASKLGVQIECADVTRVSLLPNGRFLVHGEGLDLESKAVIVATGMAHSPKGVPGEKEHVGRGVSYCATCDGMFFKGKDVAVYGSKDHAVEDALYLSELCHKVYFLCPSSLQTSDEHLSQMQRKENIEFLEGAALSSVLGADHVEGIEYEQNGEKKSLAVSALFPLEGEVSSASFLAPLGPKMDKGFLFLDENGMTSVPGLFAAGDVVAKRLRQIVNAAGEASVAATSAISYCRK